MLRRSQFSILMMMLLTVVVAIFCQLRFREQPVLRESKRVKVTVQVAVRGKPCSIRIGVGLLLYSNRREWIQSSNIYLANQQLVQSVATEIASQQPATIWVEPQLITLEAELFSKLSNKLLEPNLCGVFVFEYECSALVGGCQ